MDKHVKPEKLSDLMTDLLAEYGDNVYKIVESEAKDISKKVRSELRQVSPGDYARQWRISVEKNRKTIYKATVHNAQYQLTHLLEKPHKTGKNGHYPKHPGGATDHTGKIAAVEEKYTDEYIKRLMKLL